ncbi:antitoxin [Pyrodictium abyssi]|uniref:Antitoxin n=1 Tax=Pyrodictium abyssi TaxID=54256 RepID=A0ABM8IZ75_9CREN|nr:hypothetical protein PABY_24180 [Pyrodictium abyssi]
MSTVISIRVPRRLREELERLGIDYAEEVRRFLERRVREEKARRIRERLARLRSRIGRVEGNVAAELIREDRETR